jgi:hypothetical protein
MSNWLENNQTKSVIIYTILVAGTTWTIFNVLLDDKKLASAKAEEPVGWVERSDTHHRDGIRPG